ncbi:MAG TPA: ABC transporter permease, partial [Jatrophihabitantaceae bacterium]|nr:ABC transporter permease [Jatrophihabitantaceae bacterium]
AALIGLLVLLGLFPDMVAPYSAYDINSSLRGNAPSTVHPFGMDQVGRDVLSRVIHGARIAMLVGFSATGLSLVVGVSVGATAGYFGGAVDAILMRVVDALQAFPILVLLIAIAAALGPSLTNVIVIIGLTTWAQYARVVRADVLSLREREFVFAARTIGVPSRRIIVRHILPNVMGPIIVLASLSVAGVILLESALSFLGLGTQPPTPSWGSMLSDGRAYILTYPHIALFPGLAITVTVLAFNLLGDGLRDALDPRTIG